MDGRQCYGDPDCTSLEFTVRVPNFSTKQSSSVDQPAFCFVASNVKFLGVTEENAFCHKAKQAVPQPRNCGQFPGRPVEQAGLLGSVHSWVEAVMGPWAVCLWLAGMLCVFTLLQSRNRSLETDWNTNNSHRL